MLKPRIIDRYVAAEVIGPFVMGVGLLTFALVTGKLLKLTEMVVNHGVGLGQVMSLIGFIMPAFLELTFPMAVLLGVLLGFGRMSGDRELIAARACGISLYRLAIPVIAVAMVVYAMASWFFRPNSTGSPARARPPDSRRKSSTAASPVWCSTSITSRTTTARCRAC
jgi:lipopolysaccharide export LptBFGC system permease protein LptF